MIFGLLSKPTLIIHNHFSSIIFTIHIKYINYVNYFFTPHHIFSHRTSTYTPSSPFMEFGSHLATTITRFSWMSHIPSLFFFFKNSASIPKSPSQGSLGMSHNLFSPSLFLGFGLLLSIPRQTLQHLASSPINSHPYPPIN